MGTASKAPVRAGAIQSAEKVRAHTRAKHHHWYALVMCCGVLIAIVVLAVATEVPQSVYDLATSGKVRAAADRSDLHTGKIVNQTDLNNCQQEAFDNDTGRIVSRTTGCDNKIVLDAHGKPVPIGTVHRLNSISRSFGGN